MVVQRRVLLSSVLCAILCTKAFEASAVVNCKETTTTNPVAVDDVAYVAAVGQRVTIPVLANDVGGPTAVLLLQGATVSGASPAGRVAFDPAQGTVTYTVDILRSELLTYTITDTTLPASRSTAYITIHAQVQPPSAEPILGPPICTDGLCRFVARPPVTTGIRAYRWTFPGNPPWQPNGPQYDKVSWVFLHDGDFTVSVAVEYFSGEVVYGSVVAHVDYSMQATWLVNQDGLRITIAGIEGLQTFPHASSVEPRINFSPNAADCHWGCGPNAFAGNGSCAPGSCPTLEGKYLRTGTYSATLRFQTPTTVLKDYPLVFTVQNKVPTPEFEAVRVEPNVRRYRFDPLVRDDGPEPWEPFEWDFGDGSTLTESVSAFPRINVVTTNTYQRAGAHVVSLKLRDAEGLTGILTKTIDVANSPPIPKIRVNCRLFDCDFGVEPSIDDGEVQSWAWSFGDLEAGQGSLVTHSYRTAGCYPVTLTATDEGGLTGSETRIIPVGPRIDTAKGGGVIADAHVQSTFYGNAWETSTGDLNGILEPGESAVIEPQWKAPGLDTITPLAVWYQNLTTTDWSYARPEMRDGAAEYVISESQSDCWKTGHCYVLKVSSNGRDPGVIHNDITWNETYASTDAPTPGSPIKVHVGASFTDVPKTHWAYTAVESLLHASLTSGCGQSRYCPDQTLSRAEVAVWIVKALQPASAPVRCQEPQRPFDDVPCSYWAEPWISKLKDMGLTTGTGGNNYSPDVPLTRATLTVFLLRATQGPAYQPPSCTVEFSDVACPGHWAANWASDMRRRGLSKGCGPFEFCPDEPADRAQAAVLFTRAFDLAINRVACPLPLAYDYVRTHPTPPPVASLTFNPDPARSGTTSTATLTLGAAPVTVQTIQLRVDNPAALSIPASVSVNAFQRVATFNVSPAPVSGRVSTNVTATYLDTNKTVALDVCPAAPVITAQPTSRIIAGGTATTLSVTASGPGVLSYQWFQGAAPSTTTPVGSSAATYTTPSLTATTSYWVRVTNCAGTNSATAVVTVCYPLEITQQPQTRVIDSGSSTTLSVAVVGTGPFRYQWYQGASGTRTTPVGSDSATYTTPTLTATMSYWVEITTLCNNVPTPSATAVITPVVPISRKQAVAKTAALQTIVTGTWSQPTRPGTLLVAVVSAGGYPAVTSFSAPPGWVSAAQQDLTSVSVNVFYYPNNPGGRTSETFSIAPQARSLVLQLVEYEGIASVAPLDRLATGGAPTPDDWLVQSPGHAVTRQPKELVLTTFTIYGSTSFWDATTGFQEVFDNTVGGEVTTAVHEVIANQQNGFLNYATTGSNQPWVTSVVTFRAADTRP